MSARYFIRPKADQDLDDQAYYLAHKATAALGHRFLVAISKKVDQRWPSPSATKRS